MIYTPPYAQLRGLSREKVDLYGKPNIGAAYTANKISATRLDDRATCTVCKSRIATNAHHVPSRGYLPQGWDLVTRNGIWHLKPALIALCGSGTTGCHGAFHSGVLKIRWEWNSEADGVAWWSGEILKDIEPHSPKLFNFGYYVIARTATNRELILCPM